MITGENIVIDRVGVGAPGTESLHIKKENKFVHQVDERASCTPGR